MCPEQSCIHLAGVSPVQASIAALGSRPQSREEIPWARAGCRKSELFAEGEEAGRNKVNVSASSNYQPKGDRESRAAHVTAKATDSAGERIMPEGTPPRWISPGYGRRHVLTGECGTGEALPGRPTYGKGMVYKAECAKGPCAGRESERLVVLEKAAINRWREGALLWSGLDEGKCEGMVAQATQQPVTQSMRTSTQDGGKRQAERSVARATLTIIGEPCAGNLHARFERGFLKTGW